MGKIIERVRAQKKLAQTNRTAVFMLEAYERYARAQEENRHKPVYVLRHHGDEKPTHWLKRWWQGD